MRILVADGDPLSLKITCFLLKTSGYQVITAQDGLGILDLLATHEPDLVLLDAMLPRACGFDICRRIREISDVPLIFLSARAGLEDRVMGLRAGGDDYLSKPFEPAELLARVEAVLRRRDTDILVPLARLRQGDFTLDPTAHELLFEDGRAVPLTALEFRLLYYLMKNAGCVLSISQILYKVWGQDNAGTNNAVAVYIRRLRTKIEPDVERPRHIITLPNRGYKFEAQFEKAAAA